MIFTALGGHTCDVKSRNRCLHYYSAHSYQEVVGHSYFSHWFTLLHLHTFIYVIDRSINPAFSLTVSELLTSGPHHCIIHFTGNLVVPHTCSNCVISLGQFHKHISPLVHAKCMEMSEAIYFNSTWVHYIVTGTVLEA